MKKAAVSILIPTMFDSRYIVELCIKSIKKNTHYPDYQIIICDAGVDEATRDYLLQLAEAKEIKLIKATDWQRPKDDLVKAVDTEYYIIMHDDTQVLRRNWLTKRLFLMSKNEGNAIVGSIVENYKKTKRFFPLGLLVKNEASIKLGLKWGKQPEKGFDTGSLAYITFFSQDKFKFVPYKPSKDIRHFSEMTWPKYHTAQTYPGVDKKMKEREKKIKMIRRILDSNKY